MNTERQTQFAAHDTLRALQADMRHAYVSGAPGVLASSIAWAAAGITALNATPRAAVIALLVGGMLIHPVGIFISRLLGSPGKHAAGNALGPLAIETTVWLIFCLPLAVAVSQLNVLWFFPAMLLVIGGRYCVFQSLYGLRLYWACGATLAIAAYVLAAAKASPATAAFTGAALEAAFAIALYVRRNG